MSFAKNIEALRGIQPRMADWLEEQPLDERIQFFVNDSQQINMAYENVAMHRMEDPVGETLELFDTHVPERGRDYQSIVILYGMGVGYMLRRVFINTDAQILVYEPYPEVLRAAFEAIDMSEMIASHRIRFATQKELIGRFLNKMYLLGDNLSMVPLPFYRSRDPQGLLDMLQETKELLNLNLVGQNTALNLMADFTRTSLQNLPYITRYPEISLLHDRFEGVPGVVVSAGPSVDRPGVLDKLREIQDHCLISCVGQSARMLEKAGIVPDFVNVLEIKEITNQLEGISYLPDTNMILLPQANRKIFEMQSKHKFISFSNKDPLTTWLSKTLRKTLFGYNHQGTVSISALLHLMKMGCNPIYLIGQDLAYPEGRVYADNASYRGFRIETHADGTKKAHVENISEFFDKEGYAKDQADWEKRSEKFVRRLIQTKGWNGETLMTNPSYDAFRKAFEYLAKLQTQYQLINCSEGGAYIDGMEHLPFLEALEKYPIGEVRPKPKLAEILANEYVEQGDDNDALRMVKEQYESDRAQLLMMESKAEEAEAILDKILAELKNRPVINNSLQSRIRKLGQLDNEMSEFANQNSLINSYIKQDMMEFARTYARKLKMTNAEEQVGDIEALKENLESSRILYHAIIKGAKGLKETLDPVFPDVAQSGDINNDTQPAKAPAITATT